MYSDSYSSNFRTSRSAGRLAVGLLAALFAVSLSSACGDAGRNLPSHLAQKSAVELNDAGLQLHAQGSFKHSAMYFEFATMQNPAYYEGHYNRARAMARANEPREALRALARAYELNADWVVERAADSDLDSIRNEEDFKRIFSEKIAAR